MSMMEPLRGLSSKEVAERVAQGRTNASGQHTSRSFGEILRANLLTRFNFLLGALLVVILAVGHPQDALFGIVLVTNALIGIVQEVRAKRTLDRLAVLNAPRATVVRDGTTQEVPLEAVVLDDLVILRTGDQVVADGTIVEASGLQLDESLLTDHRTVRVIHGYGTGQLKRALAGFLQQHPLVARFATAPPEQGGGGVTVVELKD